MAVDALDLDRRSNFTVTLGISVAVLIEVAVDAVHSFFGVDIHHVDRNAVSLFSVYFFEFVGGFHGGHQGWRRRVLDLGALVIE